jgi:hypothetical protein
MAFYYLGGRSWAEVTREERFYCQALYSLIRQNDLAVFLNHVNAVVGIDLPGGVHWELAYEACFYRDLWHFRGRKGDIFSPKRTFDLCLFSSDHIAIIEAKAQQPFDLEQARRFEADRDKVKELTGVRHVSLVGLASSRCHPLRAVLEAFDGPLLTWKGLSELYNNDATLLRADEIYEPEQAGARGRNNLGGKRTGEELLTAYRQGERFCVGRRGGLEGPQVQEDLSSGAWRTQQYETSPVSTPPNRNWFHLEDFAHTVFRHERDHAQQAAGADGAARLR